MDLIIDVDRQAFCRPMANLMQCQLSYVIIGGIKQFHILFLFLFLTVSIPFLIPRSTNGRFLISAVSVPLIVSHNASISHVAHVMRARELRARVFHWLLS